jgi:hypothetical protein
VVNTQQGRYEISVAPKQRNEVRDRRYLNALWRRVVNVSGVSTKMHADGQFGALRGRAFAVAVSGELPGGIEEEVVNAQ